MKTAALLALALAACAHVPERPDLAGSLAAAERAFAAHSVREDMRAAFLAHFAPDGVMARDGWVTAAASLGPRAAPPIVLDWRPAYVEVARSGDLGLSTGPWKITSRETPAAAPAYGQFVSVWKRDAEGAWKVAVDLGIGHAQPWLRDAPTQARLAPGAAATEAPLAQAEARFARLSREGGARSAYAALGASDLRLYRDGEEPAADLQRALRSPSIQGPAFEWVVERSETSRAGDLGYARGHFHEPGATRASGYFLRVWRREAEGWRIVMDVVNPSKR